MTVEDPVHDGEVLLRRVPVKARHFDPDIDELSFQAFCPHKKNDIDGISLFRVSKISPQLIGHPGKEFYVARLYADEIFNIGLSLIPTASDRPGHVIIPEINRRDYDSNKESIRELMMQLNDYACFDVIGPFLSH